MEYGRLLYGSQTELQRIWLLRFKEGSERPCLSGYDFRPINVTFFERCVHCIDVEIHIRPNTIFCFYVFSFVFFY